MARTVQKYLDLMSQAVGSQPSDTRVVAIDDFNDAGRMLCRAYPWQWLETGPVILEQPAGQDWIDLPDDFDGFINLAAVETNGSSYGRVEWTTLQAIEQMKVGPEWTYTDMVYAALGPTQPGFGDKPPRRRLWVYPELSVAQFASLRLVYRRTWRTMSASQLDLIPDVPETFERALVLACRAVAMSIVDQQAGIDDALFLREVETLKSSEGLQQSTVGRLRSVLDTRHHDRGFPPGTIITE